MNMPGFTAALSIYTSRHCYMTTSTLASNGNDVVPQLICWWDGPDLICGEPPFGTGNGGPGGGVTHACAQCRSACWHKPPAKRAACLANCNDLVC
jgi:hypothetical protein